MKKNITFISLNYAPEDTAIGLYSTQWVNFLKENGFNVSVVTAFPYYPQWEIKESYKSKPRFFHEKIDDIDIYRYKQYVPKKPTFLKRIVHLIDFTLGSFRNLYKIKECDIVISVVPFTGSVLLGHIQKKRFKSKLWIHVQDFEFDAALQTGLGKKKNIIFSLLFQLEKRLFSKADIASTISQSMLKRLSKKTQSEQFFLPNWIDNKKINPQNSSKHLYLASKKIKILYSGNIGDKQDWNTFIEFCEALNPMKYEVVIVGDGSKKEWLVSEIIRFENIKYYPPVAYGELSNLLCSADLHILFQKTDVLDTVMPSKVLGMMASERPSLILGNKNSEVKKTLDESKGGLYYSEFSKDVIDMVDSIFKNRKRADEMGKNARRFVIDKFSKEKILGRMLDQINKI